MEHKNNSSGAEGEEIVNTNIMVEKKDRFLPVSILAAAIIIGGALVFTALWKGGVGFSGVAGNTGGTGTGGTGGTAGQQAAPTNTNVMQLGSRDAILGNVNAPVTLIEYGDYQCPFCGIEFFAKTEPQIIKDYVNTGKVRFVFRDFAFLGAESTAAANAAQCAEDQGKLWAYHDALYAGKVADDTKGGGESDGFFSSTELIKLGQQIGLDMTKFTSCVQNNTDATIVAQEKTAASAQGVNSTPTFFINGTELLGAQPYAQAQCGGNSNCQPFQPALDAAYAAATK